MCFETESLKKKPTPGCEGLQEVTEWAQVFAEKCFNSSVVYLASAKY